MSGNKAIQPLSQAAPKSAHVLVAVCGGSQFQSLWPTALFLRQSGWLVSIHFAVAYSGWKEAATAAETEGIAVFPPFSSRRSAVALSSKSVLKAAWRVFRYSQKTRQLLRRLAADVLLLPEENVALLQHVFAKEAQRAGMAAVVLPYTIDNPLEALEALVAQPRHQVAGGIRRWYMARHPHWIREHRGTRVSRLPFRACVAMDLLGLSPDHPWQHTCANASSVWVESEVDRRAHLANGVPESKLKVVGSLVHDAMASSLAHRQKLKGELLESLGLPTEKPVFVVAVPPPHLPVQRSEGEFASLQEVVSFWLQALSATGWNVVVNLHPHLRPETISLGDLPNVRLSLRPASELIPLCDAFVASISAVIRWAVAAGKPVINHDLCRFRYGDYNAAPQVVHVESRAQFLSEVSRVATEHAGATLPQPAWGLLDGQAAARLLRCLEHVQRPQ